MQVVGDQIALLTELRLRGFKCFRDEVTLPLRRLNLLTGVNGQGKSTALQALLLLHQAVERARKQGNPLHRITHLDLNGRFVRLGTYREILHRDVPLREGISVSFEVQEGERSTLTTRRFAAADGASRIASSISRSIEGFVKGEPVDLRDPKVQQLWGVHGELKTASPPIDAEEVFLQTAYVSADRLGPQDFYRWSDEVDDKDFFVGIRGEHTAEILREARFVHVNGALIRQGAELELVPDQVSAWLGYIFDGGKLKEGPASEAVLTLLMNSDGSAHYVRPVHMGFGYSYLLPILVAGLVAQPGSLLLIENPEAHLHPLAQSRVGEFLARVAAAGVQVYVESHSEHILNAFRLAVRDKVLAGADDLSVLYFRRDEVEPVLRIPVDEKGGISSWPDGFFDQRLHDFQRLFGV